MLDDWKSTHQNNTDDEKMEQSKIRPFGKWFEHHFTDINVKHIAYYGILGISKKHIKQHPKEHYERLLVQLENSSNPEVGHYIERSWNAIFYPLDDAVFIVG
jgi:hypothetical protein